MSKARHATFTYTKTVTLSCYFPEDWDDEQIEELGYSLLEAPSEPVDTYVAEQEWKSEVKVGRSAHQLRSDPEALDDEEGVFVINDAENDLVLPQEATWWWDESTEEADDMEDF